MSPFLFGKRAVLCVLGSNMTTVKSRSHTRAVMPRLSPRGPLCSAQLAVDVMSLPKAYIFTAIKSTHPSARSSRANGLPGAMLCHEGQLCVTGKLTRLLRASVNSQRQLQSCVASSVLQARHPQAALPNAVGYLLNRRCWSFRYAQRRCSKNCKRGYMMPNRTVFNSARYRPGQKGS